jgi:HK97 family phage major capsid protein
MEPAVVMDLKKHLTDEVGKAVSLTKEGILAELADVKAENESLRAELEELKTKAVTGRVDVGHDNELDRPWKSFGEQLIAIKDAAVTPHDVDKRLLDALAKAPAGASEGVSSDGGFLVQTDFSTELLKKTWDVAQLAPRCRKVPISANANGLKINAVAESSRANGSRWGGVQAYWLAEAGTPTAAKPTFRLMELDLKKLMALCYATDELLSDASAVESVIMQAFPEELSFKVDDAIFRGSGAGMPVGFLNAACTVSVAKETGQAATTIVAENIIKMRARLWARSRANSVWLINQDTEPQLHTMSLPVGTGGLPVYMPANGLSGLPYDTLYGRPIIPVEYCSTLGTVGDIVLADLSQYLLIDKQGMRADSSIHVKFTTDEMTFRFIYRVDGQPIWNSALTPFQGSNTLSPFITLATRS